MVNAPPDSRLPYLRGKGQVEEILKGMGYPTSSSGPPWPSAKVDFL